MVAVLLVTSLPMKSQFHAWPAQLAALPHLLHRSRTIRLSLACRSRPWSETHLSTATLLAHPPLAPEWSETSVLPWSCTSTPQPFPRRHSLPPRPILSPEIPCA